MSCGMKNLKFSNSAIVRDCLLVAINSLTASYRLKILKSHQFSNKEFSFKPMKRLPRP